MKNVIIFDLDDTVINSRHRQPNKPDGTLDLQAYFAMKTRENIFRDTLLPLAKEMQRLYTDNYIIVCTSRNMDIHDYDYLTKYNLPYHKMLCRRHMEMTPDAVLKTRLLGSFLSLRQFKRKHKVMFDDAKPVITAIRKMGIPCLNSIAVNNRLAANDRQIISL